MKKTATVPDCDGLELLLNYLKQSQGCDLTVYKRSTLSRRISVRMQRLGINGYDNYLKYLKEHPEELCPLLDTIFINVTGFFRDCDAWDYIADEVIPKIIASKKSSERIRLWSASCASGEEAYTLAMLMAEALGIEQYQQQVVIYATDVDEAAMQQARRGYYPHSDVAGVPAKLLNKYFEPTEQGYVISSDVRRRIVFARHNLLEDAPISKLDLLVCRNTLMYFNSEAQVKILTRFHFALNNSGFLFMGQAETLTSRSYLFTFMSIKHRIFTKGSKIRVDDILQLRNKTRLTTTKPLVESVNFWKIVFETNPVAQILVTDNGRVTAVNARARGILGLTSQHLGYHWRGLPGIVRFVGLGSKFEQVLRNCCSISLKNVSWTTAKGITHLNVELSLILDSSQSLLGVSFTFTEVNQYN